MQSSNLTQTRIKSVSYFLALVISAIFLLSGCASNSDSESESVRKSRLAPDEAIKYLFERGERYMNSGNFQAAVSAFEQLETQYPLSKATRQAQMNLIYCYYKQNNPELAVDAGNQFIKENPIHPKLDYVYYLLGLVHFDDENNRIENLLRIDRSKRPQNDMQDSMEYFQTLVSKYPSSEYTTDAKQRIVFIRERLASYDLRVAQYYIRRGIHIAAANRAKNILQKYPDTQAARQALDILEISYKGMGMNDLAADINRVRKIN
ncbi:MAG: outer membrane protein assembly factor BamD [Gammaproteobacteria bacterium]|nr:outer membrane protein assembly factor BamD [Gammaproteobacteria bacterium]